MLTKTRKWLIVLVFAFAAIFLAACKPEPEPEPIAPTSLEVFADTFIGENGVLLGGDPMELSVEVVPADAVKTVTWSSKDTSIATVDQDGKVTGHKGGTTTITATSTMNPAVKNKIEIKVYEDTDEAKVLFNAMQYIKQNTPAYVAETFTFPVYPNELIDADYYDVDDNVLAWDRYNYDYVADSIETIKCVLTYDDDTTIEFQLTLKIVDDVDVNEFTAIEAAKAELAEYLAEADVTDDIILPTTLVEAYALNGSTDTFGKDVVISWTSSMTTVMKVNDAYVDGEIVRTAVEYKRPSDDTDVTLEAYYVCGGVTGVTRHNMVAKGYTQAEKMEYMIANELPAATITLNGENVTLPVISAKFGATISWASSNETALSVRGKMDPYLATQTVVTLTGTITYVGNAEDKNFTETYEITVTVNPATSDLQRVMLDLSNKFEAETFPGYFPYGLKDRDGGNVIPLPATVGGDGTYKDTAITWTCPEVGLFDGSWTLLKQYLRYHQVQMTYAVTIGAETATAEVGVNVGVAELQNTLYVGGRFNVRSDVTNPTQPYDELHQFSQDDPASGDPANAASTTMTWSGYTYYVDVTDSVTGVVTRYQYFGNASYTFVINEGVDGGVTVDENGEMTLFNSAVKVTSVNGVNIQANYQGGLFINNTSKDIKMPLTFLNYKGSTRSVDVNGTTLIRECAFSISAWRFAFVADATAKVVVGFGPTFIEPSLIAIHDADGDGVYTLPDHLVIPAGGFAWDPMTSQNKIALASIFSVAGTQMTFLQFDAKPRS
jgi:hypothetical protein